MDSIKQRMPQVCFESHMANPFVRDPNYPNQNGVISFRFITHTYSSTPCSGQFAQALLLYIIIVTSSAINAGNQIFLIMDAA